MYTFTNAHLLLKIFTFRHDQSFERLNVAKYFDFRRTCFSPSSKVTINKISNIAIALFCTEWFLWLILDLRKRDRSNFMLFNTRLLMHLMH